MSFTFPLVALEEHFFAKSVAEQYEAAGEKGSYIMFPKPVQDKLLDLGDIRLSAMDRGQTAVQIISHAPNRLALTPETCRKANDELHAALQKHPDRFGGFATLPMAYPYEAAAELKRCVRELGFVGSLVDNITEGVFTIAPFSGPFLSLIVPWMCHATSTRRIITTRWTSCIEATIQKR
jgi:predicted TIM-barrel fold metal-dependent hydrolase